MKLEVENYQWIYVISFESKNSSTFRGEQSVHWTTKTEYAILSNLFTTTTPGHGNSLYTTLFAIKLIKINGKYTRM